MRIGVFGAGAVGGYFGGRLASRGFPVAFVARGEHLTALRQGGLRIRSPAGDLHLPRVEAADDPRALPPVDVVLVAIKAWQLDAALPSLAAWLGPSTFVVPLLNGVEAADVLAAGLGAERVVAGSCKIISRLGEPGTIVHLGATPSLVFGERDDRPTPRVSSLLEACRAAGLEAAIPPSIAAAVWSKLLFVASLGGVGAVTRAPIGVVRRLPETRAMLAAAMREIHVLAAARGVLLREREIDEAMAFVDGLPASGTTSLQRDLAAGRRSELDAWSGAVHRLGEASGVATPVHSFLYHALLPGELVARGALELP